MLGVKRDTKKINALHPLELQPVEPMVEQALHEISQWTPVYGEKHEQEPSALVHTPRPEQFSTGRHCTAEQAVSTAGEHETTVTDSTVPIMKAAFALKSLIRSSAHQRAL